MVQWAIFITGAVAILLTQLSDRRAQRAACLVGLIGQPFWLFSTWTSHQWGMFALSVLYAFAWFAGVWINWVRPLLERK
jgi:hypothetical protein